MENTEPKILCRLIAGKEAASPFAEEALAFFQEGMRPFCHQYFAGLIPNAKKEEIESAAYEAFKKLGETYLGLRKKDFDAYVEEHKEEHDSALSSSFFASFEDPELAYRLSLLSANYTLYTRMGDQALIVDLESNVPLSYIKEEEPIVLPEEKEEEPVKEEEPKEEPQEEPKEEGPEEAEESEEEAEEEENPFANIKRRTFSEKLKKASPELRKNYKAIKQAAIDCKLKGRVSKAADTYHLGRKTYLKITIAGKTLKCYFAVDAKNYADTAIPLEVSDKKAYQDTPTLLRVKSSLAVRRAISIISDMTAEPKENE